jgi:hypothetical protein
MHSEGNSCQLGRLQGEAKFWPKAAKEIEKLFFFQNIFIKSEPIQIQIKFKF